MFGSPFSAVAFASISASAAVMVTGFSTSYGLPASTAAIAISKCASFDVQMSTASTSGQRIRSR